VLARDVRSALGKLSVEQRKARILLAYEPVWAIGEKGIPATADYADAQQHHMLHVAESGLGRRISCHYCGSVNSTNCGQLIAARTSMASIVGLGSWWYLHPKSGRQPNSSLGFVLNY
jgi:triosephosphate isomerase